MKVPSQFIEQIAIKEVLHIIQVARDRKLGIFIFIIQQISGALFES